MRLVHSGIVLVLLALVTGPVQAAPAREAPARKAVVATRQVPPFAIRRDDGSWQGISVDLWREIAGELKLTTEFREVTLDEMLRGLRQGEFDAAVAALTMTAEREATVDFTHPFYDSGLGIAVSGDASSGWAVVLARLFSLRFAAAVAALAVLLFAVGFLVWIFERRRNAEQFGEGGSRGIGAAFWWSAVTMTTVGYGDKAPKTFGGRIVALVWMFASILLISSFTAAIASALTVSQLATGIDGPEDLPGLRVATVADSTSETYLHANRILTVTCSTPVDALHAAAAHEADAAVYDAPILRYVVNHDPALGLRVLPREFETQRYAIALPAGSDLREPINQAVLRVTSSPKWGDLLYRYLGE